MSNKEPDSIEALTADLRQDDLKSVMPLKSFVKPQVKIEAEPENKVGDLAEQLANMLEETKRVQDEARKQIYANKFNPRVSGQVLQKEKAPITDFSNLTLDDVYDLEVPIEAKAFMSADVLTIKLKDSNYEARWVNKNPQRLGDMIGKGFTYITPSDLITNDGIQTSLDAQGHYCFNDVVAMKIDKATYYKALRSAHLRAISTLNEQKSRQKAIAAANGFMQESGNIGNPGDFGYNPGYNSGDFVGAAGQGKLKFYDPGVEI